MAESMGESNQLRLELKEWEKAFTTANEGRKAGRNDIKKHPEIGMIKYPPIPGMHVLIRTKIAKKYKLYNKLRSSSSGPLESSSPSATSEKRPLGASQHPPSKTPQKRQKTSHPVRPYTIDPYDAPRSSHKSPIHRTSLGPTPQKDGLVLGLFDLLSPSSNAAQTPSKKPRNSLGSIAANSVLTPSKRSLSEQNGEVGIGSITKDYFKSPLDLSKRPHPSSFLTPSTRRGINTSLKRTPGSQGRISKLSFDETPVFLRRENHRARNVENVNLNKGVTDYDNEAISWSPIKVRMPPKPAGKGLSALVRGLREMEDEKLDEELNLIHEIEMDGHDSRAKKTKDSFVLINDSQVPDMPLGADGENRCGSDDTEEIEKEVKGRDGKPLKIWKKKGQKRTTRRVHIKPSKEKWKPEPEWNGGMDKDEDDGTQDRPDEVTVVAETQNLNVDATGSLSDNALKTDNDIDSKESESGSDFGGDSTNKRSRKRNVNTQNAESKGKEKATMRSQKEDEKKAKGRPASKKKAISATAHANFRALKIKNKNSKGKGGGNFRRRR